MFIIALLYLWNDINFFISYLSVYRGYGKYKKRLLRDLAVYQRANELSALRHTLG